MPRTALRTAPAAAALKELQRIPGIGPRLAIMLQEVGIRKIEDLRGRSPERLYAKLNPVFYS